MVDNLIIAMFWWSNDGQIDSSFKVFAVVDQRGTVVMSDGEPMDSW